MTTQPKKNRLSLLALEQRWVFDGAAPAEALQLYAPEQAASIFERSTQTAQPAALVEAQRQAQQLIGQWMGQGDAVAKLAALFSNGQPSAAWVERAQALVERFAKGEVSVRVELRSSAEMLGSWGAFAHQGPDGEPVIYLNADWLAAAGTGSGDVSRVLAEEWGHFLDGQLNDGVDTAGDEGEAFAANVLGVALTDAQWADIRSENDALALTIDGVEVQTELASLLFTNTSAYWIGVGTNGAEKTTLESNIVYTKASVGAVGDRYLFVSVPEADPVFSGNNTRGWLYVVGTDNKVKQAYVGEISRLYKDGSRITGLQFYVYPGTTYNENYTADRQTQSDAILIDRGAGFSLGQTYNTSSDPVSAALNSMLAPAPLVANADAATPLEAGGLANATAGTNPTGNILANDTGGITNYTINKSASATDPLQWVMVQTTSALTLTQITSVLSSSTASVPASGSVTVQGLYGSLVLSAKGDYTYTVNNNLAAVQALRGTSNTLVENFNYTVKTGATQAVGVFNLTIQGANDNPVAKDDYNFAKESITDGLVGGAAAYTDMNATNTVGDRLGVKAVGNVLPNDTDVDGYGETKTITGTGLEGAASASTSGSATLTLSNTPSSLSSLPAASYPVYRFISGVYQPVYETNGSTIANFTKSGTGQSLAFTITDAKNVALNDVLYVQRNATTYELVGTVATVTPPQSTSIKLSNFTGNVAVGMAVSGTNLSTAPTISSITYDASGNVTGLVLSQQVSLNNASLTFSSSAAAGATLTGQYGTLVLNANGSYVYTPFANNINLSSGDMRVDAFKYTMKDAANATSQATLYINVQGSGVNDPNANADTVTAVEAGGTANATAGTDPLGTGITGLLGNDTTPTGSMSVSLVKTPQTAFALATPLTGSVDNNGVTYAAKVTGLYGDLYVKTDGSYRYVVDNTNAAVQALRLSTEQLKEDFQYRIGNGSGFDWSTLTVTINGANDAPVAANDGLMALVGQYVPVGNVLSNDADVDAGDSKTVIKIVVGSSPLPVNNNVTASTTFTTGYTEIAGTYGSLRIGSDGSYTYLVDASHPDILALGTGQRLANPDVFTYQMRDTLGLLSTATLTMAVEGRNDAPVNTLPATFTAQEGSSHDFSGTVSASDVDANLASVTLSVLNGTLAVSEAGATAYRQTGVVTDPQDGILLAGGAILYFDASGASGNGSQTFTLYGNQTQINAALASLVYTPNAGFQGSDTLSMVSTDAEALRDTDSVAITVNSPALSVTGSTVNEASPYTLFTVSAKEGQWVKLALGNTAATTDRDATLGTDTSLQLQYFDGVNWVNYNAATNNGYVAVPKDADTTPGEATTLLVRVANVNDSPYEGAETLTLVATNAASVSATGISTIYDDGTGSVFLPGNTNGTPNASTDTGYPAQLDDDRPLTVSSVTVNEGSPYAVFTVGGVSGQFVKLALTDGTAKVDANGTPLTDGTEDYGPALQVFNGTAWVAYTANSFVQIPTGATTLLVRTAIVNDTPFENSQDFTLTATNTGNSSATGTGTIKDDGTGNYFAADNNTGTPSLPANTLLDDDRTLTVSSVTVNEGSPFAVFTVTGVAGQNVKLALTDGTAKVDADGTPLTDGTEDYGPALQVYNGTAWVAYTAGSFVQIPAGGTTLLVRTAIVNDTPFENSQDFTLTATNTGGSSATGTGTIKDDGTGDYFSGTNTTGTNSLPSGTLLDDDRTLTVNSVTVNEGSPFAVFTVTGVAGQNVKLALTDGTAKVDANGTPLLDGTEDYGPALQVYNGTAWVAYTAGSFVQIPAGGTTMLVRTAIVNDTPFENSQDFTLTATNTGNSSATGTGTIKDDGTGDYFSATNTTGTDSLPSGTLLDDDRALTVNEIYVNEASPTAVFTVTGVAGQTVRLALSSATGNPATDEAGGAAALGLTLPTLQYLEGTWKDYNASLPPQIASGATTLLVRVSIAPEQDVPFDGSEVFSLVATNNGGANATGVATIYDDGTGSIFKDDGSLDPTANKDDDRPLTVNSLTVNEGSPYVVFTVSGAAGQLANLALANGTTTGMTGLEYFNGSSWVTYSAAVALDGAGKLLVRTALSPEQEALLDTGETFTLTATNGSGASGVGTATVKDDGTGSYFTADNNNGTPTLPSGTLLDDDRPLSVNSLTVNEGSPFVVFTVTGATGQAVKLSLAGALGDPATDAALGAAALGTTLPALEYFEGGSWRVYDASNPPRIATGATTLLVRVALDSEQEKAADGPETFKLVATNTGGAAVDGTATVVDNGTGSYFAADNNSATSNLPSGVQLDDDRPLSVNSLSINEGSPYTVFTVSGAANQLTSLSLANGTTTNLAGLQIWNGSGWVSYSSGVVALDGTGKLLVRTALSPEQETALDTGETFTLTATNTGLSSAVGTATVKDDGTGDYFAGNNNTGTTSLPTGTLLDDDRPLAVSSVTVNEGSPYAVFTVSGAANQLASLALANQNADGANLSALQYFDGSAWQPYTSGSVALNGSGQLLVRVALAPEQETALDGPENFNLVATNTGGSNANGLGTIVDDGSGSYFAEDNNSATSNVPAGTLLDDDRPLTVNSISVNEASPTAVFTVTGATGQTVRLALSGATGVPGSDPAQGAAALGTTLPALQYYEGGTWKTYDASNPPKIATGATTLLVRVAITAEQESSVDGPETFSLVATNNGGSTATGVATLHDDGTGSIFKDDGSNDPDVVRDDDRALSVGDLTVNEGSPYAVFTVNGAANQLASLALANGTTTGMTGLQVYQGGQWVNYASGNVALSSAGTLLVRTALTPEQETLLDTGETFTLAATNTGGASATGTATVKDDGSGDYFDANNTNGTPALPNGATLDDDRPLTVGNLTVNEGSPYAVFTVRGAANQLASLSLANVSTTGLSGLQVYVNNAWTNYTGGNVALNASGVLLVRTTLNAEQEAVLDTGETFTLQASNTGSDGTNGTATGTATVMDDGTGDYFADDNTTGTHSLPANTRLDDDRALTVDSLTVREDQGPATFTVTGVAGQYVRLEVQSTGSGSGDAVVSGAGADVGTPLQYLVGSTWTNYTAGSFVQIAAGGSLQVRVPITRDALVESNETFRLAAFNTGGSSGQGTGTITDYAPALAVVTANADEAGGTANSFGSNDPKGDLVSDASMSLVSLASAGKGLTTSTTASGNVTLVGLYGTISFAANGTWEYLVDNDNASVQALLLTTNTLTETFTYTVQDAFGAQSSSALNIVIRGANDAPVAKPNVNTAKESLTADGDPAQYSATDVLGTKAQGNVLTDDTDVDAGDSLSIVGLTGAARVGTVTNNTSSSSLVFVASTTFSPVRTGDEAWLWVDLDSDTNKDNGEWRAIFADAAGTTQVTASGPYDSTNRTIGLNANPGFFYNSSGVIQAIASLTNATIGFNDSTLRTFESNSGMKSGVVQNSETSGKSTVTLGNLSGTIAAGMTVSGTGVPGGTKIASVNYDAMGKPISVVLSGTITSATNTSLSFSAAGGTSVGTQYGTLVLATNGSYTYTPHALNTLLSEGESVQEVFRYTAKDAGNLESASTLTITVLGSGLNDPNAVNDINAVIERSDSLLVSVISDNLLGNDTTPVAPITVSAARSASVANFTSISAGGSQTIQGLFGSLTVASDGSYSYSLNNALAEVQELNAGQTLTEQFQYEVQNGARAVAEPKPLLKDVASLTITINGANDSPTLDLDLSSASTGYARTFTEGGAAVPLVNATGLNLADVDSTTFTKVSLSYVQSAFADAGEQLLVNASNLAPLALNTLGNSSGSFTLGTGTTPNYSYTATVDASAGTLTLEFKGPSGATLSTAQAEALLDALRYQHTSENPTGGNARVFNLSVTDAGSLTSNATTSTITVVPVNDAGVLDLDANNSTTATGADYKGSFKVGAAASPMADIDSAITDVDSSTVASATVVLTNAKVGDSLSLAATLPAGITAVLPPAATADGSLTITFTGVASLADYESALEAIRFAATGTDYTSRVLSVVLSDGAAASNTATSTLAVLPDDRALSVAGTTVNEASPYVQFTVTGADGQRVALELARTGLGAGFAALGSDTRDAGTSVPLQYLQGGQWRDYTPGTTVTLSGTTLLVRTGVVNDSLYEGAETLALRATNDAGGMASGLSTIVDDGSGTLFKPDGTPDTDTVKDDDRALRVSSVVVNEASPTAVFTVTGAASQLTSLSLANQNADGANLAALQYFDGTQWQDYSPGNIALDSSGQLLVRVALSPEQETALDGPETFNLVATNTGGASAQGLGTIMDDGGGAIFKDDGSEDPSAVKDDDRLLSVNSIVVNEASTYAVFKVTGAAGQLANLALANGTTTNLAGLEVNNGSGWVSYSPRVALNANGELLVRTALNPEQEADLDNGETFTLTASNTGGSSALGTATVMDDGTGAIFKDDGSEDPSAVRDDDRPLSVNSITVNEGSPVAVFTVTGASGQTVKLALTGSGGNPVGDDPQGAAALGASLPALQYLAGGVWQSYDASRPPQIADGATTLLVRMAIPAEQDKPLDGPETFNLMATNTGGSSASGLATVRDDGTGSYWLNDATAPATDAQLQDAGVSLDDDRPVTVSSPVVNEASPYAVFTVDGEPGQLVRLDLAPGSATGNVDFRISLDVSVDGGRTWTSYTGGQVALNGAGGTLLVRTPLVNDSTDEPDETFTLTATNTGGSAATGTATIQDDGNGTVFKDDGTPDTTAVKDDDRPLQVNSMTVNEASPVTVFTVTGASGQVVRLALTGSSGDPAADTAGGSAALGTTLPALQYFEGGSWKTYDASQPPMIASGATTLLVRVAISPEQEKALDGPETFNLVASNTGGTSATGTATIVDDGTGNYYTLDNTTGNANLPAGLLLDDDRPLSVGNLTVNEGSPYAVFTVSGAVGQKANLALANGTTTGLSGLEYFNGSTWVAYTSTATLDANGQLLVRTALSPEQDTPLDTGETFTLTASNTGGAGTVGTATVMDDGTGAYWIGDATQPALPSQLAAANLVLDDDRTLTLNNISVNEASPFAVFKLNGTAGQFVTLALTDGTAQGADYGSGLETSDDGGLSWKPYTGVAVPIGSNDSLLVRTPVKQDALYEISESFTLKVTSLSGREAVGTAAIVDDGTGTIFNDNGSANTAAVKDDDRPLSIAPITVNEGSPYAVFTVSGAPGQMASLSLANGTTGGLAGLQVYTGGAWVAYSSGNVPLDASGTLLVRTALSPEQETALDTGETFTLAARNTGGTSALGTATVMDDGTGTVFNDNGSANTAAVKDDDRLLSIAPITVNEGSPYAVFTVSGAPGQLASLSLANGTTGGLAGLQVYTGGAWVDYSGGNVPLDASGTLLVRTALSPEQETALDTGETFTLAARNTGGISAVGTATVMDDGTGTIFNDDGSANLTAVKDDDRRLTVNSIRVNEGSPFAVFTLTGSAGQRFTLSLADGPADAAEPAGMASADDYGSVLDVSLDNGATWARYDGTPVLMGASESALVRTPVKQDTQFENRENFTLRAATTSGVSAQGRATILDDGTGDIFNDDGTENTTAKKDDDRVVPVLIPVRTVDIPVPVQPIRMTDANVHVERAVAEARTQAVGGPVVSASGGASRLIFSQMDQLSQRYDVSSDVALYVLPAARQTRSESAEAAMPALNFQILRAFEPSSPDGVLSFGLMSQAPSLADQTLAALSAEPEPVVSAETGELQDATDLAAQRTAQLAALHAALTQDVEAPPATAQTKQGFSRQLKAATQRPVWQDSRPAAKQA